MNHTNTHPHFASCYHQNQREQHSPLLSQLCSTSCCKMNGEEEMNRKVGFRFKPSDEMLIDHYLKKKKQGLHSEVDESIAEVDILKFEPEDLPAFSKEKSKDPFWYFFYRLDYKYKYKKRVDRKTEAGHWKGTGKSREVRSTDTNKLIGIKKTLVFHKDRVSEDVKSPLIKWVIHEYRATDNIPNPKDYVICRLKKKTMCGLKKKADGKASRLKKKTMCRLKKKADGKATSCQMSPDFGNHVAENTVTEVDPPRQADPGVITDFDELDYELIPEWTTPWNPEDGLSLQDLASSNSDCNWVQTGFGIIEAPSSNSFNSNCNGVQNQFGTIEPPLSNTLSSDFNGFQTHFDTTEPPSSNSFSSDCNGFQTQFSTIEPGEDFTFLDSFPSNECDAYPEETSGYKNLVAESEDLNLNWDFDGTSVAHLLESFRERSYNGGMISDTNHEVPIAQAREDIEHVIVADLPTTKTFDARMSMESSWNGQVDNNHKSFFMFPDTPHLTHNSNLLIV